MLRLLSIPVLAISTLALSICACDPAGEQKDAGPDGGVTTQIRFMNDSDRNFDSLEVDFGNLEGFGPLAVGESTDYKNFIGAFRYGYMKIAVGSDDYIQQPIDYVGETPLKKGKYTYTITLEDQPGVGGATGTMSED